MSLYTRTTRRWLDQRFSKRGTSGAFFAHMPIYGLGHPDAEGGHTLRLSRFLRLLRALDGLSFSTMLDVGGAEGYLSHVAQHLYGVTPATTDLSIEACLRAREIFGIRSAAVDCARLPFDDGAFDVVVCSEVLEHVEEPVATLLELCRVARRAVVLSTEEVRYDHADIDDYLFRRPGWPHMERNLFHPDDLAECLPGATLVPQFDTVPSLQPMPREQTIAWMLANTKSTVMEPGRAGVVATIPRPGFVTRTRTMDDTTLVERLLAMTVQPGARAAARLRTDDDEWFSMLRDPVTRERLRLDGDELRGSRSFPIRGGVPDFVDVDVKLAPRAAIEERLTDAPVAQRRSLLAMHDRLAMPEKWTQDVFDFDVRSDRRGFWPNNQLVQRPETNGFRWRATGNDPWIVTPFLQRRIRAIEIEMRIHAPGHAIDAGTAQVFWKSASDETFAEERSILWRSINDGDVHRYRIELANHPNAPDEVEWLRIDPVDGPCEVDLVSLRFE